MKGETLILMRKIDNKKKSFIHTFSGWDLDIWDFGTTTQIPALKVDFNGDGATAVAELGSQRN